MTPVQKRNQITTNIKSQIETVKLELNELQERLQKLSIDDEDVDFCPVCGEVYNKKRYGIVCCTSCYREKYM